MRFLLFLFLALAAGIGLTLFAENPGYVLLTREPWTLETSLSLFFLGLLVVFGFFYLLLRLLDNFINTPARMRRWKQQRNRQQAIDDTRLGIIDAICGHWAQAEKRLQRKLAHSPQREINLLTSAWAAQQQNEHAKRDEYIATARSCADSKEENTELAVGLVQCALLEQSGNTEQALEILQSLYQQAPANPAVINNLARLLQNTGQWQELLGMLDAAKKHHAMPEPEMAAMQATAACGLLDSAGNFSEAESAWKSLPRKLRLQTDVISSYCRALMRFEHHQDAEALIRNTLKNEWSTDLVELYGLLQTDNPAAQLKQAETWLADHQTNTTLMLCMGRLAIKNQLWGLARSYLEVAVQNADSNQAFLELARLFESLGEDESALETYKHGLQNSLHDRKQTFKIPAQQRPVRKTGKGDESEASDSKDAQLPSLAYSNESK